MTLPQKNITLPGGSIATVHEPSGYLVSDNGVHEGSEEVEHAKICSPVWTDAAIASVDTEEVSIRVKGINSITGGLFEHSFSRALLIQDHSNALAKELMRKGLDLEPGKQGRLIKYLMKQRASHLYMALAKIGWHKLSAMKSAFVLHDMIIGNENNKLLYLPEDNNRKAMAMTSRGSLADWKANIQVPCRNQPMINFVIGVALLAPLSDLLGLDSGGYHICGITSGGKTTALQIAASTFGNGVDPGVQPELAYVQKWNTTGFALQGTAMAHNDILLCMDEVGASDLRDPVQTLYNLTGGVGKVMGTPSGNNRPIKTWNTTLLSSGEKSITELVEQKSGEQIKGGLSIRLIDLLVEGSVFINTEDDMGAFVSMLKENCACFYGTAGRAFITYLVDDVASDPEQITKLKERHMELVGELMTTGMHQAKARAMKRFAAVELALQLAAEQKVIDLSPEEAHLAVTTAIGHWEKETASISDVDRALMRLKSYVIQNIKKFPQLAQDRDSDLGTMGYQHSLHTERLILIYPEHMPTICRDGNSKSIIKAIDQKGFLLKEPGRLTHKFTVHPFGRQPFYAIKIRFFDDAERLEAAEVNT